MSVEATTRLYRIFSFSSSRHSFSHLLLAVSLSLPSVLVFLCFNSNFCRISKFLSICLSLSCSLQISQHFFSFSFSLILFLILVLLSNAFPGTRRCFSFLYFLTFSPSLPFSPFSTFAHSNFLSRSLAPAIFRVFPILPLVRPLPSHFLSSLLPPFRLTNLALSHLLNLSSLLSLSLSLSLSEKSFHQNHLKGFFLHLVLEHRQQETKTSNNENQFKAVFFFRSRNRVGLKSKFN